MERIGSKQCPRLAWAHVTLALLLSCMLMSEASAAENRLRFDGAGRIAETETEGGLIVHEYDGLGQPVATVLVTGGQRQRRELVVDQAQGLGRVVAAQSGEHSEWEVYAQGPGGAVAAGRGSQTEYLLSAEHGTVVAKTTGSREYYDAFGAERTSRSTGPGFAGEYGYGDGTTWLRSRSLLRSYTGGFGQRDRYLGGPPPGGHIERPASLNRYVYAEGKPTTETDPTGALLGAPLLRMAAKTLLRGAVTKVTGVGSSEIVSEEAEQRAIRRAEMMRVAGLEQADPETQRLLYGLSKDDDGSDLNGIIYIPNPPTKLYGQERAAALHFDVVMFGLRTQRATGLPLVYDPLSQDAKVVIVMTHANFNKYYPGRGDIYGATPDRWTNAKLAALRDTRLVMLRGCRTADKGPGGKSTAEEVAEELRKRIPGVRVCGYYGGIYVDEAGAVRDFETKQLSRMACY